MNALVALLRSLRKPTPQAGKMLLRLGPCRPAAVRVMRRPQAGEEERPGIPVTEFYEADRREILRRIFRVGPTACFDGLLANGARRPVRS